MSKLRSGYTTGTHATATLMACLYEYCQGSVLEHLEVVLPQQQRAVIEVQREGDLSFSTIKGDNDDIDVTKGCKIVCELLEFAPKDLKEQEPSVLEVAQTKIFIYAGEGVGVVTKKGLKIAPPHPAINPTPVEMMQTNAKAILNDTKGVLHAVFSVVNGEQIAKETANAKVGVLGGISILGTRGIVKPVSSSAYIDSIHTEIDVAVAYSQEQIIFTLGNTAHDYAKEHYEATSIVEIGNFVYEALKHLQKHQIKKVVFITSIAKMCKVAQGFKNTHNKYGTIDFALVKDWLFLELGYKLEDEEFSTLKGVLETIPDRYRKEFVKLLGYKAAKQLQKWCDTMALDVAQVETITLPQKIKEKVQW
ncbi:MAG: cobalt-precorrin-5B (C(1))-methyltransferase [Epsilonproteobacteria bacterium]|nr:cobalt-precorrin-5B (C(1))-methyltransferase [Campylobacterota bacterium]